MKDFEEIQNEYSKNDAVGKVVRIMETLVNADRVLSVREIAAETGIPRSTAHRFLSALEGCGWAAQDGDGGMYYAGLRFFLLSGRKSAFFAEVARVASGPMRRLMERTGKTAILSVLDGSGGVCVHTEEPESAVKFVARTGTAVPLTGGATGLVLLAFGGKELLERLLTGGAVYPDGSPVDGARLRDRVEQIRSDGCAHSREEWMPHAEDVSVPVFDRRGNFAAQLGVAGLAGTFGDWRSEVLPALRDAASDLTNAL